MMNKNGFTLVELLVVTSVISLLSSTIYTSTNSVKAKAKITATTAFSQGIHKTLATDPGTAVLTFNEPSGIVSAARTSSGGTLSNMTVSGDPNLVSRSTDVPITTDIYIEAGTAEASSTGVTPDNINRSILISPGGSMIAEYSNAPSFKKMTISLWVKPITTANSFSHRSLLTLVDNTVTDLNDPNAYQHIIAKLQFEKMDIDDFVDPVSASSFGPGIGAPVSWYRVKANKWQHIVVTYDGYANEAKYYADGELKQVTQMDSWDLDYYNGITNWIPGTLIIGASSVMGTDFNGHIDDLAIYPEVLSAQEIKDSYLASQVRHFVQK